MKPYRRNSGSTILRVRRVAKVGPITSAVLVALGVGLIILVVVLAVVSHGLGSGGGTKPGGTSNGLVLNLFLNSTLLQPGQAIGAVFSLSNTRDVPVNLTPNWREFANVTTWGYFSNNVCTDDLPVNIAIFRGYYSVSNISSAGNPLQVANPYPLPCAVTVFPSSYELQANSSFALVTVTQGGQTSSYDTNMLYYLSPLIVVEGPSGISNVTTAIGAAGFYQGGFEPVNFVSFPPGEYTVAVADVWGDLVLAHVVVA